MGNEPNQEKLSYILPQNWSSERFREVCNTFRFPDLPEMLTRMIFELDADELVIFHSNNDTGGTNALYLKDEQTIKKLYLATEDCHHLVMLNFRLFFNFDRVPYSQSKECSFEGKDLSVSILKVRQEGNALVFDKDADSTNGMLVIRVKKSSKEANIN